MAPSYKHTNSKGVTYYLHGKEVTLKGNVKRFIYYFAKAIDANHSIDLPATHEVRENSRNGFLVLAKKK